MRQQTLITNARIIDGTGAAPISGSVLVDADKFLAVGPDAEKKAQESPALSRLDAKGMTVMPGLIDTHCHLSFDDAASNPEIFYQRRNALSALVASYNAKKLVRAGVTSFLDPDSIFENMIDLRDAIEAGIIKGPRMSCGAYALVSSLGGIGGRLVADEGITGYYKIVRNKHEIVAEVRRQIKYGADWIKVHVTGVVPRLVHKGEICVWSDEELELICETAHEMDTPVMGHCRGADATWRAAKAGFDLIFHATGMDERALEIIIDKKIPICPALTFQANMVDFGDRIGTAPDVRKHFEREITDSVETVMKAHAAGVPVMCGSESGFSMVPYGHWHYREMEVYVRYFGMTPLQAIQCGTQAGAFAMKMEGQIGVVAAGYKADFLIVDGDPSQDVTVLGGPHRIKHAYIDRKPMDTSPASPRKPIPGWRVANFGKQLTREFALGMEQYEEPVVVEELH